MNDIKLAIVVLVILILSGGCISINPCPYCGEKRTPDYVKHSSENLGHGIVRDVKWYGWVHYSRRTPQPDITEEIITGE